MMWCIHICYISMMIVINKCLKKNTQKLINIFRHLVPHILNLYIRNKHVMFIFICCDPEVKNWTIEHWVMV